MPGTPLFTLRRKRKRKETKLCLAKGNLSGENMHGHRNVDAVKRCFVNDRSVYSIPSMASFQTFDAGAVFLFALFLLLEKDWK